MERRDRQVVVYFVVALAASLGLGLAIAYLEVRRSQEVERIEQQWLKEVHKLRAEIELLKEEIDNNTSRFNSKINDLEYDGRDRGGDDYYYDDYEDEDVKGDDDDTGKEDADRKKRELRRNPILQPYNLILRQSYKSFFNKTEPEVKAHIIVKSDQQSYTGRESHRPISQMGNGVAAHFIAKPSSETRRHSRCYHMNERMCHIHGMYRDWVNAHWDGYPGHSFEMTHEGLKVHKSPGIYYFYAQIFYADNHDTNGYRVFVNGIPKFQCTITNLHHHEWIPSRVPYKKNSCFTGGLVQLSEGDVIKIQEIDNAERYSIFEPYKSYFGLFRVVPALTTRRRR